MPEPRFPPDERRNLRDLDRRVRAAAQLPGRRIAMAAAPDVLAVSVAVASWMTTHLGITFRQGVAITATLLVTVPAATAMEARLSLDPPGDEIGPVVAVGVGTNQVVDLALQVPEDWAYNDRALVRVEAQRTSGTGTCLVRLLRVVQR